jgi:hypothetical protein
MLTKWQRQHGVVEIDQNKPRPERPNFRNDPLPSNFFPWTEILSIHEIRLYLAILRHTWGWRKRKDAITQEQLSQELKLSRRTVQRSLYKLESHGLVRVTRRHRETSVYEILTPVFCASKNAVLGVS